MGLMWPSDLEGAGHADRWPTCRTDGSLDSMVGRLHHLAQRPALCRDGGPHSHTGQALAPGGSRRSKGVAVPGINGTSNGDGTATINGVLMTAPIESQAQGPGPRSVRLSSRSAFLAMRRPPATRQRYRPIIAKKFGAHQIQVGVCSFRASPRRAAGVLTWPAGLAALRRKPGPGPR